MYAQRGARVCVVGRRKKEIEEVELECKTIQRIKESEEDRNAFSFCADFADPEQMVMLRDIIQAGEFPSFVRFDGLGDGYDLGCCRMARRGYRDCRCGSELASTPTVSREFEARQ
jgi:NAD(P)-dependent dehydrogenase (short-subunit alcohol dehydrogenase family)